MIDPNNPVLVSSYDRKSPRMIPKDLGATVTEVNTRHGFSHAQTAAIKFNDTLTRATKTKTFACQHAVATSKFINADAAQEASDACIVVYKKLSDLTADPDKRSAKNGSPHPTSPRARSMGTQDLRVKRFWISVQTPSDETTRPNRRTAASPPSRFQAGTFASRLLRKNWIT